jgi:hypothetical protein
MIFQQPDIIIKILEFYIFCWTSNFDVGWGNITLFKAVNSITICTFPAIMVGMALSLKSPVI